MRRPSRKSLKGTPTLSRRPRAKSGRWCRSRVLVALFICGVIAAGCGGGGGERVAVPDRPGATKTAAVERAERRLFDGAPPVIPHENFGIECVECHDVAGMEVAGVGFAPPSPHEETLGMSAISRCVQCHVFSGTAAPLVGNTFAGLRQDLRRGARLNELAPPTLPHKIFMRENCLACHSGPAAREEIRTDHPQRQRCRQCHLPVVTRERFEATP